MDEIAAVCACSVDTLERRFAEAIKEAKARGRSSLRRLQWEAAQKGNTTMMIWLGKQLLEQRDNRDVALSSPENKSLNVNNLGPSPLVQTLEKIFEGARERAKGSKQG